MTIIKLIIFQIFFLQIFSIYGYCDSPDEIIKKVWYFNPDNNNPSSEIIKYSSEFFQVKRCPIEIQPITKIDVLIEQLSLNRVNYLIISKIFEGALNMNNAFQQKLLAENDKNETSYKKKLIARKSGLDKIKTFAGKKIACSSYGKISESLLTELFSADKINFSEASVIWVKRDLDAFFALALDQVDVSVVSQATIDFIEKETPEYLTDIAILNISSEIQFPSLYIENTNTDIQVVCDDFMKMNDNEKGKILLKVLGISKWKEIK